MLLLSAYYISKNADTKALLLIDIYREKCIYYVKQNSEIDIRYEDNVNAFFTNIEKDSKWYIAYCR